MYVYEVGKPYPHPTSPAVDQGRATFNEAFFDVLFFSSQPSTDAKEWGKGRLILSLYTSQNVPFLVVSYPGFDFDVSLNIFKVEPEKVDAWLNGTGNTITLFLLSSQGIIHAMHTVSIPSSKMEQIRDILEKQDSAYQTHHEVDRVIGDISERLQPRQMRLNGQTIFKS